MKPNKTLTERLHDFENFLYGFLNIPREEFMKNPRVCALYLKRLKELSKHAGSPEKQFKYIHIAGTSGKGSVTAITESILRAAGYRVGAYTSPHITTVAERVMVNGVLPTVSDYEETRPVIERAVQRMTETSKLSIPSYFEIDFLVALLIFKKYHVEYVVVETGCGGRYDATNIIPGPEIAIITNIGLDHIELLGNTKKQIAWEKVGIVKPGSQVILGEQTPSIRNHLAQWSLKANAKSVIAVPPPAHIKTSLKGVSFLENGKQFVVPLLGAHQAHNARLAISAARLLNISDRAIQKGLASTIKIGAFEVVAHKPLVIVDGAHNPDKIATTVAQLYKLKAQFPKSRVHLIFGMAHNKNERAALCILLPAVDKLYATRFTNNYFRTCHDPRTIVQTAQKLRRIPAHAYMLPHDARTAALHNARKNDIILITGSLFLAGELRAHWYPEETMLKKRKIVW